MYYYYDQDLHCIYIFFLNFYAECIVKSIYIVDSYIDPSLKEILL